MSNSNSLIENKHSNLYYNEANSLSIDEKFGLNKSSDNEEEFHITEVEDLTPNRHIIGLMLKNQKLISTIENKKRIASKLDGLEIEINQLKKENLIGENKTIPNQIVTPLHIEKSHKIPMMKDDYERMKKDSEARSFVKKIQEAINERNWRTNKRKEELVKKVLNDQLSRPQIPQVKEDETKNNYTPNPAKYKKVNQIELPSIVKQQMATNINAVINSVKGSNLNDFTFKPNKPVQTKVTNENKSPKLNPNSNYNANNEHRSLNNINSINNSENIEESDNKFIMGTLPKIERNNSSKQKMNEYSISRSKSPTGVRTKSPDIVKSQNYNNYTNNGNYTNSNEDLIQNIYQKNKSPYFFNNPKYSKYLENKHANLKIKQNFKKSDIKYLSDLNNESDERISQKEGI